MTSIERLWKESNEKLVSIIREEITSNGPMRFDRFMELVLYHPEHGYYRSPDPAPGRTGDFLTAPEAHPIFGATLARQVAEFDGALDHPGPFTIIEYGAGAGRLIRPLLAELRQSYPELYARLRYAPVELNANRFNELREHLKQGGHESLIQEESTGTSAAGCVIANEFIDAFPARRITKKAGELREVVVDWSEGWFTESDVPACDPEVAAYLDRHGIGLEDGDRLEIHSGIAEWAETVSNAVERGYVLVIDYGYPGGELFSEHRRGGTLKAYHRHGVTEEIYRGVGRQDLTAHVNFSEIAWFLQRCGFQMHTLTTQAELLERLGIGERLVTLQTSQQISADEYLAARSAVLRMIDPGAMGRFRAMIMSRARAASHD